MVFKMNSPSRDHAPGDQCGAETGPPPPWTPIADAPKDGSIIWLRSTFYEPAQPFSWDAGRGRWATRVFAAAAAYDAWWDEEAESPTHWRSLSAARAHSTPRQVAGDKSRDDPTLLGASTETEGL